MYLATVILLMGVFPVISIIIEIFGFHSHSTLILLIGKWFVFWTVGVRLLLAGLRQIFDPRFTAQKIFEIKDKSVYPIIQELGFGNLALGLLGVLTILNIDWIVPAAIIGGIFYGLAGIKHLLSHERNSSRSIAMVSDLLIFLVLAAYLIFYYIRHK